MDVKREMFGGDELATNVWNSKYAMEGESHHDEMHRRMAKEFIRAEKKYKESPSGNSSNEKLSEYGRNRKQLTLESIYELFKDFKYVVPQGSVMYGLGRDKPISISNCFVIDSAKDSYSGIFLTDQEQAQLMKRRK